MKIRDTRGKIVSKTTLPMFLKRTYTQEALKAVGIVLITFPSSSSSVVTSKNRRMLIKVEKVKMTKMLGYPDPDLL